MKWTAKQRSYPDGTTWDVQADGRSVVVECPPKDLLRLEAAVNAALGVHPAAPPDPPAWRIEYNEHHGGGPFELEITCRWYVVDADGARRWQFEAESSGHYDGSGGWTDEGSSGCDEVVIGADGVHALVLDTDEVVSWPLPIG